MPTEESLKRANDFLHSNDPLAVDVLAEAIDEAVAEENDACASTAPGGVPCMFCGATPGEACTELGERLIAHHDSRWEEAIQARKESSK